MRRTAAIACRVLLRAEDFEVWLNGSLGADALRPANRKCAARMARVQAGEPHRRRRRAIPVTPSSAIRPAYIYVVASKCRRLSATSALRGRRKSARSIRSENRGRSDWQDRPSLSPARGQGRLGRTARPARRQARLGRHRSDHASSGSASGRSERPSPSPAT
jgi:hypothetical protein